MNSTAAYQRFSPGSSILERYEIVRSIGKGSTGEVLLVVDTHLDYQTLALKVIHEHLARDREIIKRLQREVILTRQLSSIHSVRVYDLLLEAGISAILMEYVPGCNLADVLGGYERRCIPAHETIYILRQLITAVSDAHQHSIIHRDLKPSNVLLNKEGLLKLSDFGLARNLESAHGLTRTGELVGSPAYLAPEQFRAPQPSMRSDIYSIGVLGFELLTGKLPFSGDSLIALAIAHQQQDFPRDELERRNTPSWLIELLASCCAKDPALRPNSAKDLLAVFDASSSEPVKLNRTQLYSVLRLKQRDAKYFSEFGRHLANTLWIALIVTIFLFTILEPGSRKRIMTVVSTVELQSGLDASPLLRLLDGDFEPNDPRSLHKSASLENPSLLLAQLNSMPDAMVYFLDGSRETTLHRLIEENSPHLVPFIFYAKGDINRKNAKGETPLLLAIRRGRILAAQRIIAKNARLDVADHEGNYPLLLAIALSQEPVVQEMLGRTIQHNPTLPERAPRYDLPYSQRSPQGEGALHIAVNTQNPDIIEKLLDAGFDADQRDGSGRTPLMHLVRLPLNKETGAIADKILAAKIDLRARDHNGMTVLDHAKRHDASDWIALFTPYLADSPSGEVQ